MATPMERLWSEAEPGMAWLRAHLPDLFTSTMREDVDAIAALAAGLTRLRRDRRLVLADREKDLTIAVLDTPGSVYRVLHTLRDREISFAEIFHSSVNVPGTDRPLEVHRYVFDRKPDALVAQAGDFVIPDGLREAVRESLASCDPPVSQAEADAIVRVMWLNDRGFVQGAPPRQLAQLVRLYRDGQVNAGFFLDVKPPEGEERDPGQVTLLFAVENPPQKEYLAQVDDVFNAFQIGVRTLVGLVVSTGTQSFFLGSFQASHRDGRRIEKGGELFRRLRRELYNTQILQTDTDAYRDFVLTRVMTGEEASLVNAFIGFCHTNLAHAQPQAYAFDDVARAFHAHPEIALRLVHLFELRFDPALTDREPRYAAELAQVEHEIATYNTGHRMLDEFRRSVFQAALVMVKRTVKTNFFVPEKHALAFRLDAGYLDDLGPASTSDLPPQRPYRVTFFYGRRGLGYHIGFSDIARGGWRTIITRTRDDYVTVANTLFRENYVLAHTQALKNKDIYEGGSKLVCVLHAPDAESRQELDQRLHKLQLAFANAFLDIFVTQDGRAKDARVVDYYGEDEPIELGPDENMHDEMIEALAELSVRRGYVLGTGIVSSKRIGINHKQYGVTSLGVVTFAEIAMREIGVDIRRDRFTVKLTGGPNGDVAGNAIRLLLERCPQVEIRLIVDGTAVLVDPAGLDREALRAITLRKDADAFDPARLSKGGFILYRNVRRTEGLRELYRRVEVTEAGPVEGWVTLDEFYTEYDELPFTMPADLFIPAGGRPETVDAKNWRRFLDAAGKPTTKVVVEGANSFVTPEARQSLQGAGVVVMRDASANKCGVISSSYEIIGNLLLTEEEFLAHKERYVQDVLAILERRAADEATLIVRRHRDAGGKRAYTEISNAISAEINAQKTRLFAFFEGHPDLRDAPPYRRALLAHLPAMIRDDPAWHPRVDRLPPKYRSAILAAEIATAMVYRGGFEPRFEEMLERYVLSTYG